MNYREYQKIQNKKKEVKVKQRNNRIKALMFIIPIIAIVLFLYYWAMRHIYDDGKLIGMSWEMQLILGVITFVIFKQYIFKEPLAKAVKITKALAKGKTFKEMLDDKIPVMSDEEYQEAKMKDIQEAEKEAIEKEKRKEEKRRERLNK